MAVKNVNNEININTDEEEVKMSYYHSDKKGYTRDKYDNYKDASEVEKAVSNWELKTQNSKNH